MALVLASHLAQTGRMLDPGDIASARRPLFEATLALVEPPSNDMIQHLRERGEAHLAVASASPARVARVREAASEKIVRADPLVAFAVAMANARTDYDNDNPPFVAAYELEQKTHLEAILEPVRSRLEIMEQTYPNFLPAVELRAYQARQNRDWKATVELYRELIARVPADSFYPYLLAMTAEYSMTTERVDLGIVSDHYWVHASRRLGVGWRSRLASIYSTLRACRSETNALGRREPGRRTPALVAVADHLCQRANDALEIYYPCPLLPLLDRAAALYHLAVLECSDLEAVGKYRSLAEKCYTMTDHPRGMNASDDAVRDEVFSEIRLPNFAGPPV